jgi:hypothetical protein
MRPYHPPSVVKLGSIESARQALDSVRDARLLLIVERWSSLSEEIRQAITAKAFDATGS